VAVTFDGETMFCNVQYPEEDGTPENPSSAWPYTQTHAASTKRPRSATFVVTRKDGGTMGV
jgi:secreted PhoX family phosphatase